MANSIILVTFPMSKNGGSNHSYVKVYQRVDVLFQTVDEKRGLWNWKTRGQWCEMVHHRWPLDFYQRDIWWNSGVNKAGHIGNKTRGYSDDLIKYDWSWILPRGDQQKVYKKYVNKNAGGWWFKLDSWDVSQCLKKPCGSVLQLSPLWKPSSARSSWTCSKWQG